jgi:arylsulfatase
MKGSWIYANPEPLVDAAVNGVFKPTLKLPVPKLINLLTDLKEERDVVAKNSWVLEPIMKIIGELEASFKKYPPIKVGTPDPYTPPKE